jgi:hypothetical protein
MRAPVPAPAQRAHRLQLALDLGQEAQLPRRVAGQAHQALQAGTYGRQASMAQADTPCYSRPEHKCSRALFALVPACCVA